MSKKVVLLTSHKDFNFKEARKIALFYAHSDDVLFLRDLGVKFGISKNQITRLLKVAIIFSLVSDETVDKIIAKRTQSFNKSKKAASSTIEVYERCQELAKKRKSTIKKHDMAALCFKGQKSTEVLLEKYKKEIIEIENYAFS